MELVHISALHDGTGAATLRSEDVPLVFAIVVGQKRPLTGDATIEVLPTPTADLTLYNTGKTQVIYR